MGSNSISEGMDWGGQGGSGGPQRDFGVPKKGLGGGKGSQEIGGGPQGGFGGDLGSPREICRERGRNRGDLGDQREPQGGFWCPHPLGDIFGVSPLPKCPFLWSPSPPVTIFRVSPPPNDTFRVSPPPKCPFLGVPSPPVPLLGCPPLTWREMKQDMGPISVNSPTWGHKKGQKKGQKRGVRALRTLGTPQSVTLATWVTPGPPQDPLNSHLGDLGDLRIPSRPPKPLL